MLVLLVVEIISTVPHIMLYVNQIMSIVYVCYEQGKATKFIATLCDHLWMVNSVGPIVSITELQPCVVVDSRSTRLEKRRK